MRKRITLMFLISVLFLGQMLCGNTDAETQVPARLSEALPANGVQGAMPAMHLGEIIVVKEGESRDIGGEGVETVIVTNPKVVKVVTVKDKYVLAVGKSPGDSDVIKVMKTGELIIYPVRVEKAPKELPTREMNNTLRTLYPASEMRVRGEEETLFLEGRVASNYDLDGALTYLKGFTGKIVNLTQREGAKQVKLEVKIIEVNRTRMKNLGINFLDFGNDASLGIISPSSLTNFNFEKGVLSGLETAAPINSAFQVLFGSGDFATILSILEQDSIAKTLSSPSLIAEEGEEAKFFVGGTIPVPVPQTQGLVTIEWKDFGIKLEFKPRIMPKEKMKLKVKAESSELNKANGLTLVGTIVPGIDIRKIETDVTLSDGEQFIIGGLYFSKHLKDMKRVPYLADIPVLGSFFKRVEESNEDLELIAVIKPEFVSPAKGSIEKVEELLKSSKDLSWGEILLKK